jgi:hypothetical protein
MPSTNKKHSEVVESTLSQWISQGWYGCKSPPFGSLVNSTGDDCTIYGVVTSMSYVSADTLYTPIAFQQTPEELEQNHPEIFEFLCIRSTCTVVGYQASEKIVHQLPPSPARIHTPVQAASSEEYQLFFAQESYLHLLAQYHPQECMLDDIVLALLQNRAMHTKMDDVQLALCIEAFSHIVHYDYHRLRRLLQRLTK